MQEQMAIVTNLVLDALKWLMPHGIIKLKHCYNDRHLRKFFKKLSREETIFVVPPVDVDPELKGTQVFDFLGLMDLQNTFNKLGYKFKIARSDKISEDELRHNLISVGGPISNEVTKFLLEQGELIYTGTYSTEPPKRFIYSKEDPKLKFEPSRNDKGLITRDYGLITRMRNPYNRSKDVIVACGCYGWGTQAAIRILKDVGSLSYLNRAGQWFQVVCYCDIDENKVGTEPCLLDLLPNIHQKNLEKL